MGRVEGARWIGVAATLVGMSWVPTAGAAEGSAIGQGVQFLRSRAGHQRVGESAMIALALLKAEVPAADPTVAACFAKIRSRLTSGGYLPERSGGHDIYEAAAVAMALANLDDEGRRAEIEPAAQFLIGRQKPNGSWDYAQRLNGDTSISQYAILGLWEAESAGASIPPEVWDRAAQWFLSVQSSAGSWNYHRDENGPETISMTAAGVGSLLICQRQLARHRANRGAVSPLLTELVPEGRRAHYDVQVSASRLASGIKRGLAWLSQYFTTSNASIVGQSAYYGLYGVERLGALTDRETLGRVNWFDLGRAFVVANQRSDGGWSGTHGDEMNTVWAILFLTRSTAKTLRRIEIRRLGAGTLLGGRGLPKDLSSMTVAGGRVVSRPMNGAVEGMLAVLEDPRAENADAALAGLVTSYQTRGPDALRPYKDRFRKLLTDRDPGLRRTAAWALARTADLDTVPALIGAILDPNDDVVVEARRGLQLLSRKVESLGPPSPSTPDQRQEAAKRWRAWYDAIRPLGLDESDGAVSLEPASAKPGAAR